MTQKMGACDNDTPFVLYHFSIGTPEVDGAPYRIHADS